MDWSKSKSIFIFVFLILNIFLYTQYLDVYSQGQQVDALSVGEKTIEAKLKDDNITYESLPSNIDKVSYISGKIRNFTKDGIVNNSIMDTKIINNNVLETTFTKPVALKNIEDEASFNEFTQNYVVQGEDYVLWEINKEEGYALFFQKINDRTLYYNNSGYLKLYWNSNEEIYKYEQTILEKFEKLEQEVNAFLPIQVLQALYSKNLLPIDSQIISMNLGYSTLVQFTEKQVFAPTWEVRVKNTDGEVEELFVNAIEGKVIDIQLNSVEVEDVE